MTEILRFEMNVPAEVALKYAGPGKAIEGRYGNRVMYTLADNRVMYVAPIVASRISHLGIQPWRTLPGLQAGKAGQRKLIEWQVLRPSQLKFFFPSDSSPLTFTEKNRKGRGSPISLLRGISPYREVKHHGEKGGQAGVAVLAQYIGSVFCARFGTGWMPAKERPQSRAQ